MARRILIIDDDPSRLIVLKVKLGAAAYEIAPASTLREAQRHVARAAPHLVIVAAEVAGGQGIAWARRLRSHPAASDLPILVFVPDDAMRLDALRAGADDAIARPVPETMMLARIRALLRVRETTEELRLRGSARSVLGLAEPMGGFVGRGRITVVAAPGSDAAGFGAALEAATGDAVSVLPPDRALVRSASSGAPDVFVLLTDATVAALGLIPQLRAHPASRDAGVLALAPPQDIDAAVMALDLGAGDVAGADASAEELALRIEALKRWKERRERLRREVREGLDAALTDPLTGLHNRRYAMHHLARVSDRAARGRRRYAVLVCDLDRFKRVNDTHGHAAGDAVLIEVARRLSSDLRSADTLSRLGGEEFLVVMPDTTLASATAAAERLSALIRETPFDLPSGAQVDMTMSVGLALGGHGAFASGPEAVEAADRALYGAKARGRARVEVGSAA